MATTSQFGNIAGISTGLPWIMTKISPKADDYEEQAFQAGTLFPCPTKYTGGVDWPTSTTPDKDKITDQINVSVDVAIAFTIAFAVLQILSGILFVIFVINMRSKLRAQGKATGNAALDCLLGCCCCCCFLNQSLRESGITGKSYSVRRATCHRIFPCPHRGMHTVLPTTPCLFASAAHRHRRRARCPRRGYVHQGRQRRRDAAERELGLSLVGRSRLVGRSLGDGATSVAPGFFPVGSFAGGACRGQRRSEQHARRARSPSAAVK